MKKTTRLIILVVLVPLIVTPLLLSCENGKSNTTQQSTSIQTLPIQDDGASGYDIDIYTGIWTKSLTRENTYENGLAELFDSVPATYKFYGYGYDEIVLSMKSAQYAPTEFSSEICEILVLKFIEKQDNDNSFYVTYAYDFVIEKLMCCYNEQWYVVSNYDLFVDDMISMNESYTYEKYFTQFIGLPIDEEYSAVFLYDRFFARTPGWDKSIYSGFVYTEPLEAPTEDEVIERAKKEVERIDTSIEFQGYLRDPYTGYWYVLIYGDLYYTKVYLDECGRTVQITTSSADVEH